MPIIHDKSRNSKDEINPEPKHYFNIKDWMGVSVVSRLTEEQFRCFLNAKANDSLTLPLSIGDRYVKVIDVQENTMHWFSRFFFGSSKGVVELSTPDTLRVLYGNKKRILRID